MEPSAAVSVTGLINLVEEGMISKDEVVVCVLTGSGLKTKDLYSEIVGKPKLIKPGLDDLEELVHLKN